MGRGIRNHLTYANVIATVALFVALGGTSLAALTITGKDVKNGSLTGKDVRDGSIHRKDLSADARAPGAAGPVGAQGALGPAGAAGTNGARGDIGATGATGQNGNPGLAGTAGATGATGASGSDAEFNGAAAGGDLAGTFPNPTLAAGPAVRLGNPKIGGFAGCSSAPTGVPTMVSWAETEFEQGGITHATNAAFCDPTAISSVQVPRTGLYAIGAAIGWIADGSGGRREIAIVVNGTEKVAEQNNPSVNNAPDFENVSTLVKLNALDVVQVQVFQNTNFQLSTTGVDRRSNFWAHWVGPAS